MVDKIPDSLYCTFVFGNGEVPERPKGADCKSVGYTFEGSNPSLSKMKAFFSEEGLFSVLV